MNNLHEPVSDSGLSQGSWGQELAEIYIEDYLDRLGANLLGRISDDERVRQKDEARFHLERLASHYEGQGLSSIHAAQRASEKYGEPSVIADQMIANAYEAGAKSKLFRIFGRANVTAFAIVGLFQLVFITLLQWRVFSPSSAPYSLALDPGQMRHIFPWPLPLPQRFEDILVLYALPLLVPVLIGWLAGCLIPIKPGRAVAGAVMAAVLHSFFVALSLLPRTEMFVLAIFQLLLWIPLGVLSADLSLGMTLWRKARARLHA